MFALMFALARMASAAWVGAAALFVVVAVTQTTYLMPKSSDGAPASVEETSIGGPLPPLQLDALQRKHVIAVLALQRFPFYYWAGGGLLGVSLLSSAFLRRKYLKASRWAFVMLFLMGAGGLLAYDYQYVYKPLAGMTLKTAINPGAEVESAFATMHEHSKQVNGAQLVLTFLASLLLCLPGTRPEAPFVMVKQQ